MCGEEMTKHARRAFITDDETDKTDVTWYIDNIKEMLGDRRHDQASISELYLYSRWTTLCDRSM